MAKRILFTVALLVWHCTVSAQEPPAASEPVGIWISETRLQSLPMSGTAWEHLLSAASSSIGTPNLSNQDDSVNVAVMAKALVYARTGNETYRTQVIQACMDAIGTELGGRTLALGRELIAYVIAADLVGLPPDKDATFRAFLTNVRHENLDGKTLISTHEDRPNNWGTHAGATRMAIAVYLGDQADLDRAARVFRGWLGERSYYSSFVYGDLDWQANPASPVGINPRFASRDGHSIDGVLPDDQRRAGQFSWPAPKENYVYEALQGALAQAVILYQAGYEDVWHWGDDALLRAFNWLHDEADYPAEGDDQWEPHLMNYYYASNFPTTQRANAGKNVGWTAWTHSGTIGTRPSPPLAFTVL